MKNTKIDKRAIVSDSVALKYTNIAKPNRQDKKPNARKMPKDK